MKDEALKYLHAGFSVIPLGDITKDESGSKKITYPISWQKYQKERPSNEDILDWSSKGYSNLGIVTGRVSNLLVMDVDSYKPTFDAELVKSFNLPITPVQETANGGKQYFFKYPVEIDIHNAVCIGHNGSGIDIRGDGGMVIAPPTKTSYGAYSWLVDPFETPLADIPSKLLELLQKEHSSESKPAKSLVELSSLSEGEGRDNALTKICGTLAHSLHPNRWATEIFPTMMAINNTYKPPLPQKDLKRIYDSITNRELKGGRNTAEATKNAPEFKFSPSMPFSELIATQFPESRYAINPFFESGTLNMISAPPNTWKSWLMFYFASKIATGEMVLDKFSTEKAKVMIINEEDSYRSVQDRFNLLGITDKELPIYFHIAKGLKVEKKFVEEIIKEAEEKDIKVIMMDSLRSIHLADENSSTAMQEVLDNLKEITRHNITVIFTHHNRKKSPFDRGNDNAELSRGSTAINAAISGHISLEEEVRDGDKFLILRHMKSKAGPKHDPIEIEIENDEEDKVRFNFKGEFKEKQNKARRAKESIYNVLYQGGWKTVKELVDISMLGRSSIDEGIKMLSDEKLIKSITRKQAEERGIVKVGEGKANEKLYSFNKESGVVDELDEFEDNEKTPKDN